MELKKNKEDELQTVAENIRMRCIQTEKKRRQKNLDWKMPELEKEQWDRAWKKSYSSQASRFKSRVMVRSSRKDRLKIKANPEE